MWELDALNLPVPDATKRFVTSTRIHICTRGSALIQAIFVPEVGHTTSEEKCESWRAIKYRAHPLSSRRIAVTPAYVGMDGILNDIAGPQGQAVHSTPREPWPLMQYKASKRFLYKAMATFLCKAKVYVEHKYKWMVRYTTKYYRMLLPVIPEANKLGLRPAIPTTSSSSASTAVSIDIT